MQNRMRLGVAGAQIQIDYRLARNVGEAGGHPVTGDSECWDEVTPWRCGRCGAQEVSADKGADQTQRRKINLATVWESEKIYKTVLGLLKFKQPYLGHSQKPFPVY